METIFTSVPQGSILGPLQFNIYLNDLFLVVTHSHLRHYADDNTLRCVSKNINDVNDKLRIDLAQVMEWSNENYMILNANKYHYMCLGKATDNAKFYFDGSTLIVEKKRY